MGKKGHREEVRLATKLGAGWEVVRAFTPSSNLPLVLVSIRHTGTPEKEQNVRLDLDKSMFIDQPDAPMAVREALRSKAPEVVAAIVNGLHAAA